MTTLEISKTVFKYPISIKEPKFTLLLPEGWKFLGVGMREEKLSLWAEIIEGMESQEVHFAMYGTGHEIPLSATHLSTFGVGPFVFHLYQL